MIKAENFPNAYKEVYVILNNVGKEAADLIPQSFFEMIKRKMNNEYIFNIDSNEDISKINILKETKCIFAYIFLNYWATDKQKEKIQKKFRQDLFDEEINKGHYNQEQLFKNKSINIYTNNITNNENELIEYKEENLFIKIINKIFKK